MRILPVAVIATLLTLLLCPSAGAQDFCVAKPRCIGTAVTAAQLQAQLLAAQSNGTPDRFYLGAGTFAAGPYSYSSGEPVELHGTTGGSGTTLQSGVVGAIALTLAGRSASVADVRVEIALDATAGMLLSGATARALTVTQLLGTSIGAGMLVRDGATLTDSSVAVRTGSAPAVGSESGRSTISTTTLSSQYAGVMSIAAGVQLDVTRSTIAAPIGALALGGTISLADSLVDGRVAGGTSVALAAIAQSGASAAVDATRTTLVGWSAGSRTAIGAYASATSGSAAVAVRDTAMTGIGVPAQRTAEAGAVANVSLDWTAHADSLGGLAQGAGAISETNRLPAPTGFADPAAGVYSLLPGSSLVDAGDPAGVAVPGALDRDGAPRLNDGDGDCVARHDVGAYEYRRLVPRAVATASAAGTTPGGELVFSAAGSCDPQPGEALSYAWRFDDGAAATGAEVRHAFAAAGRHTATVTVTDAAGHATEASVSVEIAAARPAGPSAPGGSGGPSGPAPRPSRDRVAPVLSALRVPARILPRAALPRLGASRRTPAIAFRLSERAGVRLRFARRGRDGRYRPIATPLDVRAAPGANRLGFGGRLTRRARLPAGSYRVAVTATDAAGNRSRAATASFKIANPAGRHVR